MTESHDELRRTVEFLDDVAASTNDRLTFFWFPMLAFGVVNLGAAAVAVLFEPVALSLYWAVAGTTAGAATSVFYRRRERAAGLIRPTAPYFLAAGLLGLGAFLLPLIVAGDPAWAISIWSGLGYSLFAWLERSLLVGAVACSFVLMGLLFRSIDGGNELAWVSALSGVVLLAGALVVFPRTEAP